jgi:hypothetical protein
VISAVQQVEENMIGMIVLRLLVGLVVDEDGNQYLSGFERI